MAAIAVVIVASWRWATRVARRARQRHALVAEDRAGELLASNGFEVLGRQVRTLFTIGVDGDAVTFELRADYVVALEGRRFVAEVKSGKLAPRIETAATRRQLLEYRVAFDVDGVLLVDAEAGRISEIVFFAPEPAKGNIARPLAWLLAGAALGAVVVACWRR